MTTTDRPVLVMPWWAENMAAQRKAADALVDRYQRGVWTAPELLSGLRTLLDNWA